MERLTIPEYNLLMEAAELREVDKSYHLHLQAWLNQAAKAEKKVGRNKTKPFYQRFEDFFDYRKAVREVKGQNNPQGKAKSITERAAEYMKNKGK